LLLSVLCLPYSTKTMLLYKTKLYSCCYQFCACRTQTKTVLQYKTKPYYCCCQLFYACHAQRKHCYSTKQSSFLLAVSCFVPVLLNENNVTVQKKRYFCYLQFCACPTPLTCGRGSNSGITRMAGQWTSRLQLMASAVLYRRSRINYRKLSSVVFVIHGNRCRFERVFPRSFGKNAIADCFEEEARRSPVEAEGSHGKPRWGLSLAQDWDRWWAHVNTVMNLRVLAPRR